MEEWVRQVVAGACKEMYRLLVVGMLSFITHSRSAFQTPVVHLPVRFTWPKSVGLQRALPTRTCRNKW